MRKIHVHCLEPDDRMAADHALFLKECAQSALGDNSVVDNPKDADTILLVPAFRQMFHWYGRHLLNDPVVMRHLDRCFVLESSDGPADYLRGCYVSMPYSKYCPSRQRAIGFLYAGDTQDRGLQMTKPIRLFCFRGAPSHPVRRELVKRFATNHDGTAALMDRWMNYSDGEQRVYWEEFGASKFILCPRGLGSSTIRVQEAMQAGRVPVIIAIDWVAPTGPAWEEFSLRVPEGLVSDIPALLAAREGDAAEMGRLARAEWERYYEPRKAFVRWLLSLIDEIGTPGWTPEKEIRRWSSPSFRWSEGFDPTHRVLRRARAQLP